MYLLTEELDKMEAELEVYGLKRVDG